MNSPTVSIVIPMYNHWELTHALLLDILQYNKGVDEILVIDDGSTDNDVLKGLEWWYENPNLLPQIKVYRIRENVGFILACNKGISKASGDIIILVSNDVRMQSDVVELSRNLFAPNPKLVVGGILYDQSTGWNEFGKGKKKVVFPYIEGWLMMFTKSAWEEIGGFDEQFAPSDMEDVDFCTSAIEHGYSLKPMNNPKIRHLGAQTIGYNDKRLAQTKRNRKLFADKWKVDYFEVG